LPRSLFTRVGEGRVVELRELEGQVLPIAATIREVLWGDEAVLIEVAAPSGFDAEPHAHDHESLVYVISGRVRATIESETRDLGPGDAMLHLRGALHHIEALSDARWIEIKAPPRPTWHTHESD
jgi:quercetin dioxygenase-like cupin family protein